MSIRTLVIIKWVILVGIAFSILSACVAPQVKEGHISVDISADGKTIAVDIPAGTTVDSALNAAGIIQGPLDRTEPPLYTVLDEGSKIKVIRVNEEFSVEQEIIPFESQIVQNESLPADQEHWLQLGENGLREITYRKVFEDGKEISSNPIKSVVLKEAVPQIKMIGVQKPFTTLTIPGRLAYLADGNAWVMEKSTNNRWQAVSTGDLDGRVFSLSPDGEWLLYTRKSEEDDTINTLWAAPVDPESGDPIDLEVSNVIHFAYWQPGVPMTIAYSTVEPRSAPPGWQANNDLQMLTFSPSGFVRPLPVIVEPNSGGLYGWWGTSFAWAPDGVTLAYSRPDEIGLIDSTSGVQTPLLKLTPAQTFADWAWVPGTSWAPDNNFLLSVDHQPPVDSQQFDLISLSAPDSFTVKVAPGVGMFAYPIASPAKELLSGEKSYQIAFLQAIFPVQSETSRYRVVVMDRDGSNRKVLFPEEGSPGLDPQELVWSPQALKEQGNLVIAVLSENNLWFVDSVSGQAWQITGDGLTSRVDWK